MMGLDELMKKALKKEIEVPDNINMELMRAAQNETNKKTRGWVYGVKVATIAVVALVVGVLAINWGTDGALAQSAKGIYNFFFNIETTPDIPDAPDEDEFVFGDDKWYKHDKTQNSYGCVINEVHFEIGSDEKGYLLLVGYEDYRYRKEYTFEKCTTDEEKATMICSNIYEDFRAIESDGIVPYESLLKSLENMQFNFEVEQEGLGYNELNIPYFYNGISMALEKLR